MRPYRPRAAGALLVPLLLALVLFRGLLFLGELPYKRDMGLLFVPLKRALSEALRAGQLPEWWPWDALGMPFVAVPVLSTFHPSTVLYAVLPFQAAFVLQLVLPVPVALAGTWRLGRALGLRPVFAVLAATGFVFGAYFLGLTEFTSMSLAAAALPWLWWGALCCFRRRRPQPLVFALALASMLLAGDPHLSIMGVLGAGALGVRRARPRRLVRPVLALGLGLGLAVALSAVQILPSLLLLGESPRAAGLGIVDASYWRLDLPQLLGMVVPGIYAPGHSFLDTTYVGLSVVALAAVGALTRGRSRGPLVAIALVAFVLALGSSTPLWSLFSAVVPFWKSFQFPMKATGPAMLVLPLLAARGAQRMLWRDRSRWLPAGACALAALAESITGVFGPALLGALCAGVLALGAWRPRLAPRLAYAVLGLVGVDLGLSNSVILDTTSPDFYQPPPLARALSQAGVSATAGSYVSLWYPTPRLGKTAARLDLAQNAALLPLRGSLHGLPTSSPYLQGFSARYFELVLQDKKRWADWMAGVYGTRVSIRSVQAVSPELRARAVATDEFSDSVVVPYRRYLPRAYSVRGVKVLPRAQVLPYLRSDFRPGQEVVVEEEVAGRQWEQAVAGPARDVEHLRRLGDSVEVVATLDAPGMLVLNESYYAGIVASEEGRPLPVFPANHAVRAVPLPAGRHVVRFEYHTPGLRAGALVSAGTALLLVLGGVLQARRRRGRLGLGAGRPA